MALAEGHKQALREPAEESRAAGKDNSATQLSTLVGWDTCEGMHKELMGKEGRERKKEKEKGGQSKENRSDTITNRVKRLVFTANQQWVEENLWGKKSLIVELGKQHRATKANVKKNEEENSGR